jgi:glutaredoxin
VDVLRYSLSYSETHHWQSRIYHRTNGSSCPYCKSGKTYLHNNLFVSHPDLCKEWHCERNEKGPKVYSHGSDKHGWWKCKMNNCGCHIWKASISNRDRKNNHPYCSNQKLCYHNNLSALYPEIAKEWIHIMNKDQAETYAPCYRYRTH